MAEKVEVDARNGGWSRCVKDEFQIGNFIFQSPGRALPARGLTRVLPRLGNVAKIWMAKK